MRGSKGCDKKYLFYASSVTVAQKQGTLTDIRGHWAEKVITKLVAEKAIAGYPDGSYRPNKSITSAELASIIAGAVKLNPKEKTDHWASGIFAALYDKGIKPADYPQKDWDMPISRYQMIKLLILVNENIQSHPGVDADDAKEAIADYASIPESYRYYVEQAVKKGFIRGDQNQRINGSSTTTRAEAAVIIDQLKNAKAGQTITPKPAPTPNPNPTPDQTGYAPKPAGYNQLSRMEKLKARANRKVGWLYYDDNAYSNSGFKIEQMGMLGSDGKGGVFPHKSLGFTAKIDPAGRDDGYVSDPNYPVIRNNTDNPEYIILIGKFKGDSKNSIFIVPTKGLSGIIWENDIGYGKEIH